MPLHVCPETIENAAHFYDRSGQADPFAENLGAIGWRKDGLADIKTNLAAVDIKGGHHFDVIRLISTDMAMHQTDPVAIGGGAPIKVDSLNERAGTISNSNDGDPDLSHGQRRKTTQTEALGARVEFGNFTKGRKHGPEKKPANFKKLGNFFKRGILLKK